MTDTPALPFLALIVVIASVSSAEGGRVKYTVHTGYGERNGSCLKGDASYLFIRDAKAFDKVFTVPKGWESPTTLPKDFFKENFVVAVITRGIAVVEYTVEAVKIEHGDFPKTMLVVRYSTTRKKSDGEAAVASPLIISVPYGDLRFDHVEFVENGKTVGRGVEPDRK